MAIVIGPYGNGDATLLTTSEEEAARIRWIEPAFDGKIFRGRHIRVHLEVLSASIWFDPATMLMLSVDGDLAQGVYNTESQHYIYAERFIRDRPTKEIKVWAGE